MAPPPNTSLSPNTLADLSQFFSILSDLKCYRNAFSALTSFKSNLSQFFSILSDLKCFRNAFSGLTSLKSKAKGAAKKEELEKYFFFKLQYEFFFIFLHFSPLLLH
jgi:hypothetical protein